jgi:argininosuccinate lyase
MTRRSAVPPPVTAVLDASQRWLPVRLGEVEDRLRAAIDSGMYATDVAVEAAIAGVPFRDAYKAAAAGADSAGQGRTPEGSLAARVSPGSASDLRLDELRARWQALS